MGAGDSRHPFIFETRWGVKKDGTITAQYWKVLADTWRVRLVGARRRPHRLSTSGRHLPDANYTVEAYGVYTTNQVAGEFRGFGGLQATVAQELHADKVAQELGINPLEFRLKNSKRPGDLINNDIPYAETDVDATVRRAAERIGWERWQPPSAKTGRMRRGLGMMQGPMPSGRDASDGLVWIDRNGKVHVRLGAGNMGNLSHTGMAIIVSEVLGVPVDEMSVTWANTDRDAWTYVTDASRSCHCDGKAAYNAAQDCVRQLLALGAQHLGADEDRLEVRAGVVGRRGGGGGVDFRTLARLAEPRTEFRPWEPADQNPLLDPDHWKDGSQARWWSPHRPRRWRNDCWPRVVASSGSDATSTIHHQCVGLLLRGGRGRHGDRPGRRASPGRGARDWACALPGRGRGTDSRWSASGPWLGDDRRPRARSTLACPREHLLYEYRPPTSLDYPEMVPILIEAPGKSGPFGAKGLGESPIMGPAPAIGNAILNATGVLIRSFPTPGTASTMP